MVHLTNDAVQKKGEDYGRFERGNKVSFEEFAQYVENLGGDFTKIYARMKVNEAAMGSKWQPSNSRPFTGRLTRINERTLLKFSDWTS